MRYLSIVLLMIGFIVSPFFQVSAATSFTDHVRGRFLLAVESQGQLWYVNPLTLKRTYVATDPHIYDLMREEGLGISNKDLEKIPVGLAPVLYQDTDNDGLPDSSDPLLYNESNVTISGVTTLNITVGGNATNGSFSGEQEILFYDQTNLMVNFSHNFSTSNLDLSQVTITKISTSLIVNLSGQLQSDYNKTLYRMMSRKCYRIGNCQKWPDIYTLILPFARKEGKYSQNYYNNKAGLRLS